VQSEGVKDNDETLSKEPGIGWEATAIIFTSLP
jgi:hypothetical protein